MIIPEPWYKLKPGTNSGAIPVKMGMKALEANEDGWDIYWTPNRYWHNGKSNNN